MRKSQFDHATYEHVNGEEDPPDETVDHPIDLDEGNAIDTPLVGIVLTLFFLIKQEAISLLRHSLITDIVLL